MKSAIAFGLIAIGVLLLVASTLWGNLFPATSTWTDEKANRSSEIKLRLVYLGGFINSPTPRMRGGPDPASAKAEFDALTKEEAQLNAEFESAANAPKTMSRILKWSGISLAALGIIGWYAVKQSS